VTPSFYIASTDPAEETQRAIDLGVVAFPTVFLYDATGPRAVREGSVPTDLIADEFEQLAAASADGALSDAEIQSLLVDEQFFDWQLL
jgi:hypothetical protein